MHKFINYSVSKKKLSSNVSDSEDYCPHSITFISWKTALFTYKISPCIYDTVVPCGKNLV
jgi:hypothetical protein